MAKFPSHNDRRDVGAWKYVLNRLAERAGIEVSEVDLRTFAGGYHTFLARRHDHFCGDNCQRCYREVLPRAAPWRSVTGIVPRNAE